MTYKGLCWSTRRPLHGCSHTVVTHEKTPSMRKAEQCQRPAHQCSLQHHTYIEPNTPSTLRQSALVPGMPKPLALALSTDPAHALHADTHHRPHTPTSTTSSICLHEQQQHHPRRHHGGLLPIQPKLHQTCSRAPRLAAPTSTHPHAAAKASLASSSLAGLILMRPASSTRNVSSLSPISNACSIMLCGTSG